LCEEEKNLQSPCGAATTSTTKHRCERS